MYATNNFFFFAQANIYMYKQWGALRKMCIPQIAIEKNEA
jgi:hypothetical protein